jgi:CheY-like chemotaxis protein
MALQAPLPRHLEARTARQLPQFQEVILDALLPVLGPLAGDEQATEGGIGHEAKLPVRPPRIKCLTPRTMGSNRSPDRMAIFGQKKQRQGSDQVLAYLEEAQRLRTPITLQGPKGREVQATLSLVAEDRVTLALQGPLLMDKGAEVGLLFVLDGLRIKAPTTLLEVKPGSAVVEQPERLVLAERRKKPRARLNAREGATATALTGLFDGVGVSGPIENISEGGLRIRVERAMDVKTQRKMHMGPNLFSVGQALMLVKLSKLPKCPPIELSGTVAYLEADSGGLCIGIAFEAGKEGLLAPIRSLVASRATAIPAAVPPKARRSQEEASAEPDAGPIAWAAPRTPSRREPELPPEPALPAPPAPPEAAPEAPDRSQALLRVKKRARGVLLAMPEGPDRDRLAAFLAEEGYGRILLAATLTELLEALEGPGGVHLVLVDGGVAELKGLELASLLQHRPGEDHPPVILAEAVVDTDLVLGAQETGVAQILVKPYAPDADLARMIEGHLGLA